MLIFRKISFVILTFLVVSVASSQEKVTISGYVRDAFNGEALIGSTILFREMQVGGTTNVYGFYSLSVPKGNYVLEFRFLGFQTEIKQVELIENTTLDVELSEDNTTLEEVVVTAEPDDNNVVSNQMSANQLSIKTITKMPAFLGEVDVVNSLRLLPGVTSVGEGASGFNVRGGGTGENLILLDEATIYNSSHMLGVFSVFNPDAVRDVKLIKGGISSRYGGRLSSVLDVRMKEGNNKRYEVNGGIGTIFSRLSVEGPIKKEKVSFIVSGRRSYIDILARPFVETLRNGARLHFYDVSTKVNWRISEKSKIFASGFFGRDIFKFDKENGIDWGSKTGTLRWSYIINDKLFSNYTFVASEYDYKLQFGASSTDQFKWQSDIKTLNFRSDLTYFHNPKNEIYFGAEAIMYTFTPFEINTVNDNTPISFGLPDKRGLEYGIYIGNNHKVTDKLGLNYGVRFSGFQNIGGYYYSLNSTISGDRKEVGEEFTVDKWEKFNSYNYIEPRFSFLYRVGKATSIKGSYQRVAQYIHLTSNTTASNPLDVWVPSSNNVKPQIGSQIALGYFKNFKDNAYELSLEAYYKTSQNRIAYIDGAELLLNQNIETDLLNGEGRAYGVELLARKSKGKLTGFLSYTLSRAEQRADGINYGDDLLNRKGDWYLERYDQTHNFKFSGFYEINERWSISNNLVFLTGTPTTFPTHRYEVQGITIPHNAQNARNNVRIPNYFRVDFSATLLGKKINKKGKERKNRSSWVFTVYNVLNKKNPFSIYFRQDNESDLLTSRRQTEAVRLSVFGSFVPSVSYNFKF